LEEKSESSKENKNKRSGCMKLAMVGFGVLVLIGVFQILKDLGDSFGDWATLCCPGLILMIILLVIFFFRKRPEDAKERIQAIASTRERDLQALLNDGEELLSQGKREQAVGVYLQAYQEGSPAIRALALKALDNLGEVEEF
jgi:hypothetical protein